MAHLAFQMAGLSGKSKKTLDISYCDLLVFYRELKTTLAFAVVGYQTPFRETRSRCYRTPPGLLHS
jgi:hypothetical protein